MTDKKVRLSADIREDIKKEAQVKAIREGLALQQVVERFLAAWVMGNIELPEPIEDFPIPARGEMALALA